jgi:hypothetical protein
MEHFLCFWCLEVLPVCLQREVKPFIIWFYPPLLNYDVSLHKVVELFVVIPTSPRSSKNGVWMPNLLPRAGNSRTGTNDCLSISVWIFFPEIAGLAGFSWS